VVDVAVGGETFAQRLAVRPSTSSVTLRWTRLHWRAYLTSETCVVVVAAKDSRCRK
jgi:hypothetical protein